MQLTQLGDAFAAFREWTTTNAPWIGAALIAAWFLRYYLKFRGNESGVDPVSASFRGVQLEARLFARRVSTLAMFVGGTAVVAVTILVNAVPALVTGDVAIELALMNTAIADRTAMSFSAIRPAPVRIRPTV